MSNAKQCDICGTYFSYTGDGTRKSNMVHKFKGWDDKNSSYVYFILGPREYDICRPCYHAIQAVINGRRNK